MICLSGAAGKLEHLAFLRERGHGRLIGPDCWKNPKLGIPYGIDNGAFAAWRGGHAFPEDDYLAMLAKVPRDRPPFMAVCPDRVAAGMDSLAFSDAWRTRLDELGYGWMPWYLAVQDGMPWIEVHRRLESGRWAGIFVGGTMKWKKATAADWVAIAHAYGLKCHVGRVYQLRDVVWAERIRADSIDSTGWARQDKHSILDAAALQSRLGHAKA